MFPLIVYRIHDIFFLLNSRDYFNIKYFLRRKKDSSYDENAVRKKFCNLVDSKESKIIFERVHEYIKLFSKKNANSSDYFVEEFLVLESQASLCVTMLYDLQKFYRSGGFYQAKWMNKYDFQLKYDLYVNCIYSRNVLVHGNLCELHKIKDYWLSFIGNLLSLNNPQVTKLTQHLELKYGLNVVSLADPSILNLETLVNIYLSMFSLNLLDKNDSHYSQLKVDTFMHVYSYFLKYASDIDYIHVCDNLIYFYALGVDKIISAEIYKYTYRMIDKSTSNMRSAYKVRKLANKFKNIVRSDFYVPLKRNAMDLIFRLTKSFYIYIKSNLYLYKFYKVFKKFFKFFKNAKFSDITAIKNKILDY